MDARAVARPQLRLPDVATLNGPEIELNTRLSLSFPRRVVIVEPQDDTGVVTFKCNNRELQCARHLLPVIELLDDGGVHYFHEISALGAPEKQKQLEIKQFIQELLGVGLVMTDPNT